VAITLLQLGKLKPEIVLFSIANGVGAALIIVSLLVDLKLSASIIEVAWFEVAWLGISLVGVGSYFLR
jgi:hypothetical protein